MEPLVGRSFGASMLMTTKICANGWPAFSILRSQHTDAIPMRKRDPRTFDITTRRMDEMMRRKLPRGLNQKIERGWQMADALNDISFDRMGRLPQGRQESFAAIKKTREVVRERLRVDEESDDPRWTLEQRAKFRKMLRQHRIFQSAMHYYLLAVAFGFVGGGMWILKWAWGATGDI